MKFGIIGDEIGKMCWTHYTTSKLGGIPDLEKKFNVYCETCGRKMTLLCQLYKMSDSTDQSSCFYTHYIFICLNDSHPSNRLQCKAFKYHHPQNDFKSNNNVSNISAFWDFDNTINNPHNLSWNENISTISDENDLNLDNIELHQSFEEAFNSSWNRLTSSNQNIFSVKPGPCLKSFYIEFVDATDYNTKPVLIQYFTHDDQTSIQQQLPPNICVYCGGQTFLEFLIMPNISDFLFIDTTVGNFAYEKLQYTLQQSSIYHPKKLVFSFQNILIYSCDRQCLGGGQEQPNIIEDIVNINF